MKKLLILLLSVIPLYSMDSQEIVRTRSGSIIIDMEPGSLIAIDYARSKHPIAYRLVHSAMNGNSDAYVIKTIGKSLDKDRKGVMYKELRKTRQLLQQISNSNKEKEKSLDKEQITEYIIKELSENLARKKQDGKSQRKQKIFIAACGVIVTVVTSASTALAAYFAK